MQLQVIKRSDHKIMPWKNGLGVTAQIDIFPPAALFPGDDFHWRLSSAAVSTDSTFSQFPHCERWLVAWQGAGFVLNEKKLLPHEPLHFSGEEPLHCRLVNGEVLDLGVIFRPTKVRAEFSVVELKNAKPSDFATDAVVTYFFCAKGQVHADKELLQSGDTLKITGQGLVSLSSAGGATCYMIKVIDA
ncbi:MAG: HutD family protein [Bdellovibrio sp.]|nr:HutD family protein [Bdellovibrio sp.]